MRGLRSTGPLVVLLVFLWNAKAQTPAKDESPPGKVRTYYIAADEVQWNYQPGIPLNILKR